MSCSMKLQTVEILKQMKKGCEAGLMFQSSLRMKKEVSSSLFSAPNTSFLSPEGRFNHAENRENSHQSGGKPQERIEPVAFIKKISEILDSSRMQESDAECIKVIAASIITLVLRDSKKAQYFREGKLCRAVVLISLKIAGFKSNLPALTNPESGRFINRLFSRKQSLQILATSQTHEYAFVKKLALLSRN